MVVARRSDGHLFRYPLAAGKVSNGTQIGHGFSKHGGLVGVGDLDGDGRKDLLDRRSDNTVWVYYGAKDGWSSPKLLLTGLPAGTQVN